MVIFLINERIVKDLQCSRDTNLQRGENPSLISAKKLTQRGECKKERERWQRMIKQSAKASGCNKDVFTGLHIDVFTV